MIERYSRKELKNIWEDYNKYSIWLDIELAAAEAMEKLKIIPRGVVKKVKSKAKINVKRILEIEGKVKHDVIAFLTSITEKAGMEARYLHKGMTFRNEDPNRLSEDLSLMTREIGNVTADTEITFEYTMKKISELVKMDDFDLANVK